MDIIIINISLTNRLLLNMNLIEVGIIINEYELGITGEFNGGRNQKLDIKNEKLLLVKLLPFKDEESDVASIVEVLEHNTYAKDKKQLDKKLLKEIIAKYDIS